MQYKVSELAVASRVEALSVVGARPKARRSTARTALRDARDAWFAGDWERELALAYYAANRLDDAEAALDAHADPEAGIIHARAFELYGWIEVRRERYPIAARHFLDALEVLRTTSHRDALMVASLLHGMTGIALDTLDLKLFARVRADVDAMTSSKESQTRWFAIRRDRAFVELLEGNAGEAFEVADETLLASTAGAQRVGALVTMARVVRAAGDTFTPERLVHK